MSLRSIRALQHEYPDNLRFVFRHFPLDEIHPHARAAAETAEAAGAQGKFWEMHQHLFEHQKALEDSDLHQYAIALGLEPEQFESDRTSPEVVQRIDRDRASGERSGVRGTPTFYVNGLRHAGPFDVDSLRSAIVAQLNGGPKGPRT
jgi:protein-disulfide isomerase